MNKVYLCGPITNLSYEDAIRERDDACDFFKAYDIFAISPMRGKDYLNKEKHLKAEGYTYPLSTDKAIITRDYNDVVSSDVVIANLLGSDRVSIGSCFELAWAFANHIFTIVVMEEDNIHKHSFIKEAATVITNRLQEAYDTALRYFGVYGTGGIK